MRKVLSFVLVLSLVLGSFSMAFAADTTAPKSLTDIAGTANEDAIQVNFDLGIVTGNPDGTFLPEKGVNRAEFAAMITRALAIPESALAGYTATKFKDMSGYGWATSYIAFCESKGIMLGDGNGNVMPGRNVNTNEAMTMVLRAVGYTANSSELTGVWPANYISLAQNKGLYDSVAKTVNVDKANAAQIVYNALTVQKVSVNTDGKTEALEVKDASNKPVPATLLTTGLNCQGEEGIMTQTDATLINIQNYIGQYGTMYKNDNGKGDIIAFLSDSTQLVGKFATGTNPKFIATDSETEYNVGSLEYTNSNDKTVSAAAFVNTEDKGYATEKTTTSEIVLNVSLSGKTVKDVYSVAKWEVDNNSMPTAGDLKSITDNESLIGSDFILDDDDAIDMNSFVLSGVSSLDKIAADNVVYVYEDKDGIRKVEVGTTVVEGVVSTYKNDKATISSKTYKTANKVLGVGTAMDSTQVSVNVKAYLDARGFIYDYDELDNVANNVAVMVRKSATGLDDSAKMFLADGVTKTMSTKNADTYAKLPANNDTLMAYGLNKSGQISSVSDVSRSKTLAIGSIFKSNTVVNDTVKDYVVKSDTTVFVKDGSDYSVTTMDKVTKKDPMTKAGQILLDKDGAKVIAVLVDKSDAKGTSDDVFAVLNNSYLSTDAAGDKVTRIDGFASGEKIDKFTDSDTEILLAHSPELFKVSLDKDGVVTSCEPVVTSGDDKVTTGVATAVDGRNSISTANEIVALGKDVKIYEYVPANVGTDNDVYKVYSGTIQKGVNCHFYEVDKDKDGVEVVIFVK